MYKNPSEAVKLEAIRGTLELPKVKENLIKSALKALEELISNSNKIVRFGALRTLDKVNINHNHN